MSVPCSRANSLQELNRLSFPMKGFSSRALVEDAFADLDPLVGFRDGR